MTRAQQALRQHHPELAIPEFESALSLRPDEPEVEANLGVLLHFSHQDVKALPHLRAALAHSPDLWKIRALLGLSEARLHDPLAASDLAAALPHLKGEKVEQEAADTLLGLYLSAGDRQPAAGLVASRLEADPADARLLLLSYRLHSELANDALLTLALSAPHSAEMHQLMARELARHAEEAAALENYRQAIALNPKLTGLYFEYGTLLYNSTSETLQAQAATQFREAVKQGPNDERSQLMLGKIAAARGDTAAAYEADSRALQLQPDDPDACSELARVLLLMKQPTRALPLLQHAIALDPTDPAAHYRLGSLYRQQGQVAQAQQELAEYQKYKKIKDQLGTILREMKMASSAPNARPEGDDGAAH